MTTKEAGEDAIDDMALLQRWRDGEGAAGNALIRRHYPFVYELALRRLSGDVDGAKEIAQRTFEVLLNKRDQINKSVRGYLRRVVMLDVLSYRRRRRVAEGRVSELEGARRVESEVAVREELKLMVKALRSLPLKTQLLLAWVYGDELTQREVAETLELSVAACNARIGRARQALRRRLEVFRGSPHLDSTLGGFETWLASVHGRGEEPEEV